MSNFHAGQKVVCITRSWWKWSDYTALEMMWYVLSGNRPRGHGPAYGETCTVAAICADPNYINLVGWEHDYEACQFRPIDPLMEELDRIEKEGAPEEVLDEPQTQPA